MPFQSIDPELCSALLRTVTDRVAEIEIRPAPEADLSEIIAWVKQVSQNAAATLRAQLAALYPHIGWMGEEDRPDGDKASYWLYDPVDGAYHFLQHLPLWAASLALIQNGRTILSIVYDPLLREVFIAQAGAGASCNGKPIDVAAKTNAKAAVVGTAIPPLAQVGNIEQDQALALIGAIAKEVFVVRPMAAVSLQLAYVAAGRLDGYWENGNDAEDWLAGALLVNEAGGVVSDFNANAAGWCGDGIVAANPALHKTLQSVIARLIRTGMAT